MPIHERHQFSGFARANAIDNSAMSLLRETAGDFCADVARSGRLSAISARGLAFIGCEGQRSVELQLSDLVVAADHAAMQDALIRCLSEGVDVRLQVRVLHRLLDPVQAELVLRRTGAEVALVIWNDVTRIASLQLALRQLRDVDQLTAFYHRDAFTERVIEAAGKAEEAEGRYLLVVDFHGWPTIKRALGRIEEANAIRQIAERVRAFVSSQHGAGDPPDLARLADARFAALVQSDDASLDALLAALKGQLALPLASGSMTFSLRPRMVVLWLDKVPNPGSGRIDPLEGAEAALDARLEQIESHPVRLKLSEFALLRGPALCKALNGAFVNGEFDLAWLPVFEIGQDGDRRMHSFRIELQWVHDGLQVSPADFLPLASASGLLRDLTSWAMRVVAAKLPEWKREGIETRCIAPLMRGHFAQRGLVEGLGRRFDEAGLDKSSIFLELDAATLGADPDFAQRRLTELKEAGFQMALKDAGGAASAIADLARWPLALVTLDPACMSGVHEDPARATLGLGILQMMAGLEVPVVAAGIDEEAQWAWLLSKGAGREWPCLITGAFAGEAMTAARAGEWLGESAGIARQFVTAGA